MSVKIRLRRMGRTNKPFYRVVATDSRCSNTGQFLETLGWYDPDRAGTNFSLKIDRVDYWKGNGAILSNTVKSLVRKTRKGLGANANAPEPVAEQPAPAAAPVAAAEPATSDVTPDATPEEKPEES